MSFYGNILNRLDRWRLKVGETTISTQNEQEIQLTGTNGIAISASDENSQIEFSGEGLVKNIAISSSSGSSTANHTTQTITLTKTMGDDDNSTSYAYVSIPTFNITKKDDAGDGKLTYQLQYGNEVKTIDIPLDLILASSEVIIQDALFKGEDGESYSAGTYLHLVFKTSDAAFKHCYINVTALNEIAGNETDTIVVGVDANQKITAYVKDNSIDTAHLVDEAVTTDKIYEEAVTSSKIASATIDTYHIKDGAITVAKIEDGAITAAKIDDGAITLEKIADSVLTSDNVYFTDDLITTYDIGNVKIENGQATIAAEGKTLNEVWQTIFVKEINTSLQNTAPSCSMSGNSLKYYLVGATSETQTITLGLNKGSYDYGYGYVESKDETDPDAGTPAKTRVTNDGAGVVAVASNPYTLTWDGTPVTPTNGNVFSCVGTTKTSAPAQAQVVGKVKYEKAGNPVSNLGKIYYDQAYPDGTSAANTQTLARWYYPFYQGFTVDSDVIADPSIINADQLKALNAANMTTYRFSDDAASVKDSDRRGATKFVDANAYNKKKITKATAANAWRQYFLAYPKEYGFEMSAAKDSNNIDCTVRQANDVTLTFNNVDVDYSVYYINNDAAYNTKTISWTLN